MKRTLAGAMLLALAAPVAHGKGLTLSTMNRAGLFKSQLQVLDRRAAQQYSHSDRLRPDAGRGVSDAAVTVYTGRYTGPYLAMARTAARAHAVPEDLFLRLVQKESGFNPGARSVKGAIGLAQLMPDTARRLNVDPTDPQQNLDGGARYLRQMYDRYGTWKLALAAYNAGPDAVDSYSGVPPYGETVDYVKYILGP